MPKKMTKSLARSINAAMMHEIMFINRPGCGVTADDWLNRVREADALGVALYTQIIKAAKQIDPTFTATLGTYDNPMKEG